MSTPQGRNVRIWGLALFLTMLGPFLVSMDVSITNALQPPIERSFHGVGTVAVSWTITAYAITFAAVLVPAGRIADRVGRRRIFIGGLALFAAGSATCGAAPDLPVLLIGRVVQGTGAAAAQPASLGLLLALRSSTSRSLLAAWWAAAGAVGIALGPVVGGAIAVLVSWRWAFLVNVPIIAGASVLTPRALPETERQHDGSLPDPLGALVLAAAAALVALAISQLTTWGAADPKTDGSLALGLLLGCAFAARCRRVADPLLRLDLLRSRHFALLTVTTVLYAASFFGLLFSFVLFLTSAWRLSTVEAGLNIVPMAVVVVALSSVVGRLPARFGFEGPLATGAGIMAGGLLLTTAVYAGGSFQVGWIFTSALIGVGIALCYLLLGGAAVAHVPPEDLAAATGLNQCARQLGAALGIAAAVAAIGASGHAPVSRFHLAWLICAGFASLAAASATVIALDNRTATQTAAATSDVV
jgi:EmrB/QacA subfamily drug resistance transporter